MAGGSDRYFFELSALLTRNGHDVVPFCAADDRNEPSDYAKYFPAAVDPRNPRASDALRFVYSGAARRAIRRLLADTQPDVAHLHIYYGRLTASILKPLRQASIPIVQTLHEYKLLCPVYTCMRHGEICEDCHGSSFWKALAHRCNRGSLVRSAASMVESYASQALGATDGIDHFIGVSRFMTEKMRGIGIAADRITTIHNFVDTSQFEAASERGRYVLYFGRLEATKGLFTLIEALRHRPDLRCIIAGTGPARAELEQRAESAGLKHVEFPGFVSGSALHDLIRGSVCTVLPSEWYENCPMSVLESMALGRPVIGTRIGGIPELIDHDNDGLLVEPGDADALAAALAQLADEPAAAASMGAAGRAKVATQFSPEVHYRQIESVYRRLL